MSRPWKHPKTGVYWLRKRVPDGPRAAVGASEELESLATRDPEIAEVRSAQALIEVQRRWVSLRVGTQDLSGQEAHSSLRVSMTIGGLVTWKIPANSFFEYWLVRPPWTEADPRDADALLLPQHLGGLGWREGAPSRADPTL